MLKHLEEIADKLRECNLVFDNSTFEDFLWKYALETMKFEGIPVRGTQKGYMRYLMFQKGEDMLKRTTLLATRICTPLEIKRFHTYSEIQEMVQREHHAYGLKESRCPPLYKSLKTPSS